MTSRELSELLLRNADIYKINDGGITFSGGEPLMQYEFLANVCKKLTGIHLALQTSGYTDTEVFKKTISRFNYIMFDIKLADRELHKKYTGVYNDIILENLEYLKHSGIEYILRIPLIPDITDTKDNLRKISEIAGSSPVELLSYNHMAGAKYESVGLVYPLKDKNNNDIDLTLFKNAKLSK